MLLGTNGIVVAPEVPPHRPADAVLERAQIYSQRLYA